MTTRSQERKRLLDTLSDVVEIYSVETSDQLYRFVIRQHADGSITLSQFKRIRDRLVSFSNKRLGAAT